MGGKGFAPRPTHLRALEGVEEARLNRDEVRPPERTDVMDPPFKLDRVAKRMWDRLVPDLVETGVMTHWDREAFAMCCRALSQYLRAADEVETSDDYSPLALRAMRIASDNFRSYGQRFGLTPGDRAALRVETRNATKGNEGLLSC